MSTSLLEAMLPEVLDVAVSNETLSVELSDGRTLSVPTGWYPRLAYATDDERAHWTIIDQGHGVHWRDLDEDVSLDGLLGGRPSGESQGSLKKWLAQRTPDTKGP